MFNRVRSHLTYANVMVTLLAIAVVGGGAVAIGAIPSSGTITGCMNKKGGALRVIDQKRTCKRGERKLTWNQEGRPGAAGQDGAPGQAGHDGQDGQPGAPAFNLFAYVSSAGHKQFGTANFTITHTAGTGSYSLVFDRTLGSCVLLATAGRGAPSESGDTEQGGSSATTKLSAGDLKTVTVATTTPDGTAADRGFSIAVLC